MPLALGIPDSSWLSKVMTIYKNILDQQLYGGSTGIQLQLMAVYD